MMCKIFIHSPKRLRLQVLGGSVGREGVSSGATSKDLHPAWPSSTLPQKGLGGAARAAVRLGLNLVDHRARLPRREKQP